MTAQAEVAKVTTGPRGPRAVGATSSLQLRSGNGTRPYPVPARSPQDDGRSLHCLPLPTTEPAYQSDDEVTRTVEQATCPGQGVLTLLAGGLGSRPGHDRPVPPPRDAKAPPATRATPRAADDVPVLVATTTLARVSSPVPLSSEDDPPLGPQHTSSSDLPDPAAWARRLSQILVEILTGHRPHTQLLRWTNEQVYRQVRRATSVPAPVSARRRVRPVVGTVRVCEPADGVAEISAVVRGTHRVQALALRMEGQDRHWVVTALQTG